jgi:hypothetical protein
MTPRLASICEQLGISAVPTTAYRHPGETHAVRTMENLPRGSEVQTISRNQKNRRAAVTVLSE